MFSDYFNYVLLLHGLGLGHVHKRKVWGCRGCGRIPNTEKLAIIRAKSFNIWAKCAATFTYE